MENLISKSVNILSENQNIQTAYNWMDLGDLVCGKMRSGVHLNDKELDAYNELVAMCEKIKLDDCIQLYRGLTTTFDPLVAQKQANSMSPDLDTAETYGSYLIKVVVPAGSNAFYVSAWQCINTGVDPNQEKEVVLLPGTFTLCGNEGGIPIYRYEKTNRNTP